MATAGLKDINRYSARLLKLLLSAPAFLQCVLTRHNSHTAVSHICEKATDAWGKPVWNVLYSSAAPPVELFYIHRAVMVADWRDTVLSFCECETQWLLRSKNKKRKKKIKQKLWKRNISTDVKLNYFSTMAATTNHDSEHGALWVLRNTAAHYYVNLLFLMKLD